MSRPVDLRSDTVTMPTERMRRAMAEAEVGDDWYGDDPTVNRLQDRCADLTGKERALYVATGTMANEIALHVLVRSGHLVVCESDSHVSGTEVASAASMSGIAFARVSAPRGVLTADLVAPALAPDPYDVAVVDLLSLENTHNEGGGTVMSVDEIGANRKLADEAGVPVYLDGARIFNAAAATGTPVGEFAAEVHALMFCLSKGLGAPIGSVLCGPEDFMAEARRVRILFGGAWRQAGIMAAAGLVALDEGPEQLPVDHANARRLAEAVEEMMPGSVDLPAVQSNMVYVDLAGFGVAPWDLLERLRAEGVLTNVLGGRIRMVTHRDVTEADIGRAIDVWRDLAGAGSGGEGSA